MAEPLKNQYGAEIPRAIARMIQAVHAGFYLSPHTISIGLIGPGLVGGALLGRTIDTRGDRTLGTLGGAVAGGLLGREIERSGGNRRCR